MRNLLYVLLTLVISVSCKKDKTTEPKIDCGCTSKIEKTIRDVPAYYNGIGGLVIFEKQDDGTTAFIAAAVCNTNSSWVESPDPKNPDYLVSGNIKTKCNSPGFWTGPESIEITNFKKAE